MLGMYGRAKFSLTIIFSTFVLMVMSSLTTFYGDRDQEQAKLVLIVQYVLPMFAWVFGQMYAGEFDHRDKGEFERTMFWGSLIIMVLHLLASWLQGSMVLVPNLFYFSIYQYLESVPIVLVSAFLVGYFRMVQDGAYARLTPIIALVVGMYIGASATPFFLFVFVAALFIAAYLLGWGRREELSIFGLGSVVAGAYVFLGMNPGLSGNDGGVSHQILLSDIRASIGNIWNAWSYHFQGLLSDARVFFLGHPARPPRDLYPSAYNYYLGLVYNFGLFALFPLLWAMLFTGLSVFRAQRRHRSPGMRVLGASLMFLLLIQNSISVSMQQPYPAIFIFFLWGVYLSRVTAVAVGVQEAQVR